MRSQPLALAVLTRRHPRNKLAADPSEARPSSWSKSDCDRIRLRRTTGGAARPCSHVVGLFVFEQATFVRHGRAESDINPI